jgi:hypothetical protein
MTCPPFLSTLGRTALILALGLPGFAGRTAKMDIKNISNGTWTVDFDYPAAKETLKRTMNGETKEMKKENGGLEVDLKGKTTCVITYDRTKATVQGGGIHFTVRNKTTKASNKERDHGFTLDESGKLTDEDKEKDLELFTLFPGDAGGNKTTTLQIGLDDFK